MADNAPNRLPNDDDVHPITQVPPSDNEEEVQEFPLTLFEGVLTQVGDGGEKSGGSEGSPDVAVVGPPAPVLDPPLAGVLGVCFLRRNGGEGSSSLSKKSA